MFIEINVLYTLYSERRTLDVVLVPGCLFDISGHKVRFNSKGWASLKKGANLKITVRLFGLPGRCGRLFEEGGIWVSILRPSMFSLQIVERTLLKIMRGILTSSAGVISLYHLISMLNHTFV